MFFSEGATDEVMRVEANISGPFPSVFVKPFLVAGVQSPARLFISWQIPCHGGKESASSFDRGAALLLTWFPLSCIVNQPADRPRRTIWLLLEPLPVPRQQRYFPRNNPEFRPTRPNTRWSRTIAFPDIS